ncbi:hypothetical protein ACFQ6B_27800 [Streptomyces wedmorensis]|uniref:SDR family NAD(P)-dependent oxidoreductase n=1 Tax=Streptomyces wedmorensis TaxID=43759 RepID=A0ABW6IZ70_STRWE
MVVTGAGTGVGRATARAFAGQGAAVALLARGGRRLLSRLGALRALLEAIAGAGAALRGRRRPRGHTTR